MNEKPFSRVVRCLSLLALLALSVDPIADAVAQELIRCDGQVLSGINGLPLENAQLVLDRSPADGTPEFTALTDPFGFFTLKDVPPGDYELSAHHPNFNEHKEIISLSPDKKSNPMIRLVPIDARVVFELFFQIYGLATHARLASAQVTAQYWRPDGDLSGPPDRTFVAHSDFSGAATFSGMVDGFYTFDVARPGWESVSYTPSPEIGPIADGKIRLIRSHLAAVFLKPVRTDLRVTVQGYDPVNDEANRPLKQMVLNLTGWDPALNAVLVPTQSAFTGEDGMFQFQNLVPVDYKLTIGRLGYVPMEIVITPNANGGFDAITANVDLEPTKVRVILESPYQTSAAVEGATVLLRGIRESNTEGIERQLNTTVEDDGVTVRALFENLLPGRYWIQTKHKATLTGLPTRSGPLVGPSQFQVEFFARESYGEVSPGATEDLRLELEPVPAAIQGRLWATDELSDTTAETCYSEPYRLFHQIAHDGILFQEHQIIDLLEETHNVIHVETDASGYYTALVTPGIFGVALPGMSGYSGHNIEFGDLTQNEGPKARPWPYAVEWPYDTFEFGHHGAGLRFDSNHEYQLDLFLHKHYLNISGSVHTEGSPFGSLILLMNPDGTQVSETPYNHLSDTGAQITLTGPVNRTASLDPDNRYFFSNLTSGSYTLGLEHPDYVLPPVPFTVSPWPTPGEVPSVAPFAPSYFFSGITHCDAVFNLKPTWAHEGSIRVKRYIYSATQRDYVSQSTSTPDYFTVPDLPNRVFSFLSTGGIPSGPYTIWERHGNGWYSASGSGSFEFDGALEGGPLDNTDPDNSPVSRKSYRIDLHAVSSADPSMEIPGITVDFPSGRSHPAGGEIAHDTSPYPSGATDSQGQWTYSYFPQSRVELIDSTVPLFKVTVFMNRAMVVSGRVRTSTGEDVPGAAIVIRNRFGNPIGSGVTTANGSFRVANLVPQPVYVDMNRRGFVAQRHRFDPESPKNPDILEKSFELEPVPEPTIETFTMNRFGLFLPGVTKSGDSNIPILGGTNGFNPENGRAKLTATWKVNATAQDFDVSLPGFVGPDKQPQPREEFQVSDEIEEVWIVDRRAFPAPLVNEPDQSSFLPVDPPTPLNYITVREWLSQISAAKKDGKPYYVVHQLALRSGREASQPFEDRLRLWELPSGVFKPRAVVITRSGGVAIRDYELPSGVENPLQGMNLPRWAATILEAVGFYANVIPGGESAITGHFQDGFLKLGSISPKVEARIGLIPTSSVAVNWTADDDLYLSYKYVLGVDLPLGEGTAESGPLALGPKFLGLKFSGASAEFEVSGNEKKAALAIVVETAPPEEVQKLNQDYKPPLAESAEGRGSRIKFKGPDFKASAKVGHIQTLDSDPFGNNRISDFGFVIEAQGTIDIGAEADITPVIRFLPYGVAIERLNQRSERPDGTKFLTINAVFESTLGLKYTVEMSTKYPAIRRLGETMVPGGPTGTVRGNFLGGLEPSEPLVKLDQSKKYILRIAVGLNLQLGYGAVEGTGLIQLGAPKGASDMDGVFITVNTEPTDPFIKKIEGAVSFVLRAKLNLWVTQVSKQWQYDLLTFVVDRNSEPSFDLVPLNISTTEISAASAPQQNLVGKDGIVLTDFYDAGSLDLTDGASSTLVFTGVDPATGNMTLLATSKVAGEWTAPVEITKAAGIISVASTQTAAGTLLAAWSEVDESDRLNPFPSSTIRLSISTNGGNTWTAPATLTSAAKAMFDLKLVSSAERSHLFYVATDEGPNGDNQSLHTLTWDGAQWSQPTELLSPQPLARYDAAAHPTGEAMVVSAKRTGDLDSIVWDGNSWTAPLTIATNATAAISVNYDFEAQPIVAWQDFESALNLSHYNSPANEWLQIEDVVPNAHATECRILPIGDIHDTKYLLAWVAGGESTSIWTTWITAGGTILAEPRKVSEETEGTFHGLHLRALEGTQTMILARHQLQSTTVRELVVGLPTKNDCDGDGIPDAQAITSGIVQDCNRNGIPDSCDLLSGTSYDRNLNGVPDECESALPGDCNGNGIPDRDEIYLGLGTDENLNGILDECEDSVSGPMVLTIPILNGAPARFYRAQNLSVRTVTAARIEIEYVGALEESSSITGPWVIVE
jgi:hypothetical protein